MLEIKPAKIEDAFSLYRDIRPDDYREVLAGSGNVLKAIHQSIKLTTNPQSAWCDDQLIAIWGVVSINWMRREGCPWMLGTTYLYEHKFEFLRHSVREMRQMLNDYDVLRQYVDARNRVTIDWLKWLGFTIHKPVPFGRHGEPFHLFEYRKNV